VDSLKREELPAEMQKMSEPERKAYVEAKAKEREKIQQEINKLNAERSKYVAQQMKNQHQTDTLDSVMIAAIRELAGKKDYKFEP